MKKFFKLLVNLGRISALLKEAREAFDIVEKKVSDPEVLKEIKDIHEALKKFSL